VRERDGRHRLCDAGSWGGCTRAGHRAGAARQWGRSAVVRAGEARLRGVAARPPWSGAQRSALPRAGLAGVLGGMHNAPASTALSDLVQISHYGGASPAAADETGRYSKMLVVNNRPISLQHRGRAYVAKIQAVRDEWRVSHAGRESQPARACPRRSPWTRPPSPATEAAHRPHVTSVPARPAHAPTPTASHAVRSDPVTTLTPRGPHTKHC